MSLLKKVNASWQPSEKPGLAIGEVLEVTNYEQLVKSGMAVLVDEMGNELELPGQKFTCPICFAVTEGLVTFNEHISSHLKTNKDNLEKAVAEKPVVPEAEKVASGEELRKLVEEDVDKQNADKKAAESKAKRIAALTKAREAKKAKAQ